MTVTRLHDCQHPKLPPVEFDEETAKRENLSAEEVRKRWPRREDACPDCGRRIIRYASSAHYAWGDW